MAELTEEEKRILEEMKQAAQKRRKQIVTPHMDKFTDNVLVPSSEYKDWREVSADGERRPPKQQRRKRPPSK